MLIVSWVFSFLFIVLIIYIIILYKKDKKYEDKIKKSLKNEFIIDPDTGIKLTLEEAESGHWISHDNEHRHIPKSEIEKLPFENQKTLATAISYLRENKRYKKTILSEGQIEVLTKTKTLYKYDDWTYSNAFSFENGILLLIEPVIYEKTYFQEDYSETQSMFWLKIDDLGGHYYLREKSFTEGVLDRFRNDDCLQLEDYESFTFKKSYNPIKIHRLLKKFENQKGLEIEFNGNNLFIKTLKLINIDDIQRIEKIIKNIG
jgi:hypothetical protein